MEISLRGKKYVAENLTDLNYLPIGNLFLEDDGNFLLANTSDFESLSVKDKYRVTSPILKRLIDPDIKASIAQALVAIFPSLPSNIISYKGKNDFRFNLTLQELLEISIQIANAISVKSPDDKAEIEMLRKKIEELETKF